ncbi:hypothetical protein Acsp03_68300 [Actinomadura sp. NBRC 104412]|nr:hypothetical protein Acsp03_68300 [Actinomadura sp. NBRC 104412]
MIPLQVHVPTQMKRRSRQQGSALPELATLTANPLALLALAAPLCKDTRLPGAYLELVGVQQHAIPALQRVPVAGNQRRSTEGQIK